VSSNIVPFRATGPRTDQGKRIASMNALRHGLYASTVVVRGVEDPEEYQRFARQVILELEVDGALEMALAERLISALWRLRRVRRFETEQLSAIGDEAFALLKAADEQHELAEKCREEARAMMFVAFNGYHRGAVSNDKLDTIRDGIERVLGDKGVYDGKLLDLLDRGRPVRLKTARAAFHEAVLLGIRAGGAEWKLDASREDYANAIRFELTDLSDKAEEQARTLRTEARSKQISALMLVDDESERGPQQARTIADVERRLERQISRALDDFWKHRCNVAGGVSGRSARRLS
jgi:hypothetical protein